ncbi:glucose dehydrogenase [FAD, quinone]-like [Sitodiplosis mosellana]|uniref:glucose dehydrogenase [FAD, quinone]-like n=1 Tax=Sitodiplosis mosellana TaxID=263140 RepID=UPI00244492A1|nr:glucose dehydrogenase [FAD, quinone]-like [Sitodiplosis mosellana]
MSVNLIFFVFFALVCSEKWISAFDYKIHDTGTFDHMDFIIIGAGTGGCVMANRLSENPKWKVLLLEVGDEESDLLNSIPLTSAISLATKYNWGYQTERAKKACLHLIDGVCHWPKGRALGGTSVINLMVFNRGHRDDFDGWARAGNDGWSYDEVLPYFKKFERIGIEELKSSKYRGTEGNVDIQHPAYRSKLLDLFLQAGKDLGYKVNDPNGKDMLGFSQVQTFTRNGKRLSAAKAYITPIKKRENLFVSMRSWVTRILIDPETKVAYGVEFVKNRQRYRVNATKEVILSAGVIASPQLLMLSGIGPAEHLQKHQIPVVQNLNVGYNLQDHVGLIGLAFLVNDSVTISETSVEGLTAPYRYFVYGDGPFTLPGAEGLAFVKTPNSTLAKDYPDIELVFAPGALNGYLNGAASRVMGLSSEFVDAVYGDIKGASAFSLVPILMRPKSRGRISLKSTNPFQWPKWNRITLSIPMISRLLFPERNWHTNWANLQAFSDTTAN